jgi:small subunit ribosomal protein S2
VDTNADPDQVTIPIAGNDDAIKSVRLITGQIADAIIDAQQRLVKEEEVEQEAEAPPEKKEEPTTPPPIKHPARPRARLPVEGENTPSTSE